MPHPARGSPRAAARGLYHGSKGGATGQERLFRPRRSGVLFWSWAHLVVRVPPEQSHDISGRDAPHPPAAGHTKGHQLVHVILLNLHQPFGAVAASFTFWTKWLPVWRMSFQFLDSNSIRRRSTSNKRLFPSRFSKDQGPPRSAELNRHASGKPSIVGSTRGTLRSW